jgi:hypothetical protein
MRNTTSTLGLAFALSLSFVCCAVARPATTKDLAGRKICWDNGETSAFLPGGKYENSRHGSGTWKVTPTGLEIHSETFGGTFQVEMRNDGTILDATYRCRFETSRICWPSVGSTSATRQSGSGGTGLARYSPRRSARSGSRTCAAILSGAGIWMRVCRESTNSNGGALHRR